MAERTPQSPSLDQILREQAAKAEASGVADSLNIEGIPTTPSDISELHERDYNPMTPSEKSPPVEPIITEEPKHQDQA